MITTEQNQKAQAYLTAADREFAAGNPLAATGRLWNAVVRIPSAMARRNDRV